MLTVKNKFGFGTPRDSSGLDKLLVKQLKASQAHLLFGSI
jgi:hypothetical protein